MYREGKAMWMKKRGILCESEREFANELLEMLSLEKNR